MKHLATLVQDGVYDDGVHQPRERAVPCWRCQRSTWNWNALCDAHQPATTASVTA